jgi:hypothetical protein
MPLRRFLSLGALLGDEEDQLRLDLSREMRAQRSFDHAEDFCRR